LSGKAAGATSAAPRRSSAPTMPPSAIAPICPHDDGTPSAMMAAATASVARGRSGASVRAMPSTAWATTATAATLRPCNQPEPAAEAKRHEGGGRGQGESAPGRQGPGIPAAQQADGDAHLARGRPGQERAERDQVGVALVVEPGPPAHELLAEIAEMGDRSAEGGQPEPKEHA